jgi:hypothetical protein
MSSFVHVECPHCGVKGKLVVPDEGMILIGPCPQCDGFVAVFCGKALPLDRETMVDGTGRDRRDHLMEVLTAFLERSIGETLEPELPLESFDGLPSDDLNLGKIDDQEHPHEEPDAVPISQDEVDQFVTMSLPKLDDREYFRTVFRN